MYRLMFINAIQKDINQVFQKLVLFSSYSLNSQLPKKFKNIYGRMKQTKSLNRKKSNTKISDIVLPFQIDNSHKRKTQKLRSILFKESENDQSVLHAQVNQRKSQNKASQNIKSKKRIVRINSLNKLIKYAQKEFLNLKQRTLSKDKHNHYTKLGDSSLNQNFTIQTDNHFRPPHGSLTKARSLTGKINGYISAYQSSLPQNQVQPKIKRLKKQRSLTKIQSQWTQGRFIQKEKERQKTHKFDIQKIGRAYDYLGKLRKTTFHKNTMKKQFPSLKNLSKDIGVIEKCQFQLAQKEFNRKINPLEHFQKEKFACNKQKQFDQKQQKKSPSPKIVKKNTLKIAQSHGISKNQTLTKKTKRQKDNRVSTDEPLFRNRQSDNEFIDGGQKEVTFYSEMNGKEVITTQNFVNKNQQKSPLLKGQFSQSEQNFIQKAGISEYSETFAFDKVYFFSKRLSAGFASLFKIQRINLKSKANQRFVIEVVIKAYEQILVQKIVYHKNKRSQTFKRLKPIMDKDQQKEKLKNQLFSELIIKKQMMKNRQSQAEELVLNSQKVNLLRNSGAIEQLTLDRFSGHTIERVSNKYSQSESIGVTSPINFSQVSIDCYQSIIEYIQRFCQLEISYLGASLKQSESSVPLINQLMKKKHSQMQETLMQSFNLAKVLYFLIKINATYYVAKSVIIANRKIRHFILYEFSNMIRHSKNCIIEEQQELPSDQQLANLRKYELVDYMYGQVVNFFNSRTINNLGQKKSKKHEGQRDFLQNSGGQNIPLLNALQICFGTIRQIGIACQVNVQSQRLYRIIQSNYRNDVRWQKIEYDFSSNITEQNFFVFHNAFDYGLLNSKNQTGKQNVFNYNRPIFMSPYLYCSFLQERLAKSMFFQYFLTRNFQIRIQIYSQKSKRTKYSVQKIKPVLVDNRFRQQQFLLLHLLQDYKTSEILNSFLKKQYVQRISTEADKTYSLIHRCRPFFNMIKAKKYYVSVYVPFLSNYNALYDKRTHQMKKLIFITIQSRSSLKKYSLKISIEEIFDEMKEYHRLYSNSRQYHKYLQLFKKVKKKLHTVTKQLFVQKLKFFISKLQILKKNNYSQFYFIPLPNLISQASYKASSVEPLQKAKQQRSWNSLFINQNQKSLVLGALSKLQSALKQQQKASKSVSNLIRIKNFPTYQIYYKSLKKLIPGYYVIVTIYFVPFFDLSQIKFYISKIHKSFYVCIRKNTRSSEYENLVMSFMEFLKQRFFTQIIGKESDKISHKYKQFYSKMMKQAESPFISKTRKNKNIIGLSSIQGSSRINRQGRKNFSINDIQFTDLTQQLLCKVFQSKRKNKYLIRLFFPSSQEYIQESKRKGIDETINISVFKQNSMLIYKFQTTARRLLSKKITHKFNLIQLSYQQKNKPFYILFEEIKFLIQDSDQSTYGLLNTFRSYFLNKHLNSLGTNNLVSVFSINLLTGLSNNFPNSDKSILGNINRSSNYPFDSQKQLNVKKVHTNMYQRFCLFVEGNQMLEVLKKRNKYSNRLVKNTERSFSYQSKTNESFKTKNDAFVRRGDRKQSIEAFMLKQSSIRGTKKQDHNDSSKFVKFDQKSQKICHMDFMIEDSYQSPEKNQPEQQEKIVYLINKQTEMVQQIQSSCEDQSFTINIPFSKYNKRMFKRFFKNQVYKNPQEEEQEASMCQTFYFNQGQNQVSFNKLNSFGQIY